MKLQGIDVSTHQGTIDWNKVKASGIGFAVLRAGFGQYSSQKDKRFEANYSGAKAAGIPVGAYHYSYAKSSADAVKEAKTFLGWLAGKQFEYPVYFDIEDSSVASLSKETLSSIAQSFCETMENAGYFAGIYANKYWLTSKLDYEKIKNYTIWLAHYTSQTDYSRPYGIWQYSSTGRVNGIQGNVDMNYSYEDFPATIKKLGLNGFGASTPSTPDITEPAPAPEYTTYTVRKNDSLTKIAAKYHTNYQVIARINGIKDPDLIYTGQQLKIPLNSSSGSVQTYTVKKNDTLSKIAGKYGTTWQALASFNGISNPDLIYPGQIVLIP